MLLDKRFKKANVSKNHSLTTKEIKKESTGLAKVIVGVV